MARLHHPITPLARRVGAAALVLVFVLAQTLGLVHRGLHAELPHAGHGSAVASVGSADVTGIAQALQEMVGDHEDASDCRLFDVLAQAGCGPSAVLALAFLPPAGHALMACLDFVARWVTMFDARGPPATR